MSRFTEMPEKCPRCNSENLERKGVGAYIYGQYEWYEWFCPKCKYSEQEFIHDNVREMQI